MSKKERLATAIGTGFHYSKDNDNYVDELMQNDDEHPFYPQFVYELACLSCTFAVFNDLGPEDFIPISKTHKINAEQLVNTDVDFILKLIGYYYTKDYRILDNIEMYRGISEKFSNNGMTALYNYLKNEEFPNNALMRLINKETHSVE